MAAKTRTRRIPGKTYGLSLYVVEAQSPPPTFNVGDGRDNGRNLLGALLIGPSWVAIGYVLGSRGHWCAYGVREWNEHRRTRSRRAPLSQWSPQATVEDGAHAVAFIAEQVAA